MLHCHHSYDNYGWGHYHHHHCHQHTVCAVCGYCTTCNAFVQPIYRPPIVWPAPQPIVTWTVPVVTGVTTPIYQQRQRQINSLVSTLGGKAA